MFRSPRPVNFPVFLTQPPLQTPLSDNLTRHRGEEGSRSSRSSHEMRSYLGTLTQVREHRAERSCVQTARSNQISLLMHSASVYPLGLECAKNSPPPSPHGPPQKGLRDEQLLLSGEGCASAMLCVVRQLACGPNAIRSLALSTALGCVSQHRSHIADFIERENGLLALPANLPVSGPCGWEKR